MHNKNRFLNMAIAKNTKTELGPFENPRTLSFTAPRVVAPLIYEMRYRLNPAISRDIAYHLIIRYYI